ncbi:hypothetical protein [Enterococcus sp. 5H]|uniref:hypothetical protein n=1 Tax=Enterococcus sp. 5H TaxID=1229490 RepID=UPI002304BE8D|nr:hypothetical protein [Enterococcus sp. 5H]MDA9471099.1 hypothetical protein [Enterococcus sp. 5H]
MDEIMNKINEWGITKIIIVAIIVLMALVLVGFLIEKLILFALRKLDDVKVYKEDKLIKKLLKTKRRMNKSYHDPKNGQMYYACEYWKWQENKFYSLDEACKNRPDLEVTKVISTDLKKRNNKPRRYKKQIRAYFLT